MKDSQDIVASYNAQAVVSDREADEGGTGMLVTAVDVVDAGQWRSGAPRQSCTEGAAVPSTYNYSFIRQAINMTTTVPEGPR